MRTFARVGTCSETLCNVLDRAFGCPMQLEERASMPLAGGIIGHGYQCGQLWGAVLAAGAQVHDRLGSGPRTQAAAVVAAQKLVAAFVARYKHMDCRELTGSTWKTSSDTLRYLLTLGPVRCFSMAGGYARIAFGEIEEFVLDGPGEAPVSPVSCAAIVAERLRASDLQAAMAAGFAGGIGLSGGACGALGAAIWMREIEAGKDGVEKSEFLSPRAKAIVDRFLEGTGGLFECSKIVGRRFEDVSDHAAFLQGGGCARIIDLLAG